MAVTHESSYFLIFCFYAAEKLCVRSNFEVHCSERNEDPEKFYSNKFILAPMVRMNTLPFRLLALDYGADIVYSPEIIDHAILVCIRKENDILNTVDYVDRVDGSVIFRTCPRERNRIIFQIGTSDPDRAARAAKFVAKDVAGIDINMGCPKHFSTAGGMGAALLCNPDNARKIIESVRRAVDIPVTCKIRVHPTVEDTISFCKLMVESGVSAIAIHGRTAKQRPSESNQMDVIRNVSTRLSVPVIANGESNSIRTYDDLLAFRKMSGCASVMIARAAQDNPSIFRKEGKLPTDDVIREYLKHAANFNHRVPNIKYCIQAMHGFRSGTPRGKAFLEAKTLEEICKIWEMDDYCRNKINEYKDKGLQLQVLQDHDEKSRDENETNNCNSLRYKFTRTNFVNDSVLPKSLLLRYAQKYLLSRPKYHTWEESRRFRSVVIVNGTKYTSTYWEKNKQSAEQGAAAVCLSYLKPHLKDEFDVRKVMT